MKKGRHRRFEEARAFKLRATELATEPCPECGADPEDEHASWCLATEDDGTVAEEGGSGAPGSGAPGIDGAGIDGAGIDGAGIDGAGIDGGIDGGGIDGAGFDGRGVGDV